MRRSDIYWADLGPASGSRPAKRRRVLVIQSDSYNNSRLATVLAAVITSDTALATLPDNVFLPAVVTGLPRDSALNVTALVTVNETDLTERVGEIPPSLMHDVRPRVVRRARTLTLARSQLYAPSVWPSNPGGLSPAAPIWPITRRWSHFAAARSG